MRASTFLWFPSVWIGLASATPALFESSSGPPRIFREDPRFSQWVPAGIDDSRSPCPALNSLANHGFLPHSGKNINLIQIVVAMFQGLGVSPEVSAVIGAIGAASSRHPLTLGLDLEDLSRHLFLIEHDCSLAREDSLVGDNNAFNSTLWDVALSELPSVVGPLEAGRARSARIKDNFVRNPRSVYGPRAAAFGFIENGLFLSALGTPVLGTAKREYVQSFFEQEKLPYDLGWRVAPLANNVITVLGLGAASILGDRDILLNAGRIVIGTPSDILQTIIPPDADFLTLVTSLISGAGFDTPKYMQPLRSLLQSE